MTVNQVIEMLYESYLAKDNEGVSKYPKTSVKMMNPKKEGKPLDGKSLVKNITEGQEIQEDFWCLSFERLQSTSYLEIC